MPELPEVETVLQGLNPHLQNQTIKNIVVRENRLRWKIPASFVNSLKNQRIIKLERRGKYLLVHCHKGSLIIHLGMSGSLRLEKEKSNINKHDHVDIFLSNKFILRFNDPRRFGCMIWTTSNPVQHALLKNLGPEPLSPEFNEKYLYQRAQNKKIAIKNFIMASHVVVGVGNIYANEALFKAKIHPEKPAGKLDQQQYAQLVKQIKKVLQHAIKVGGTTIRNFSNVAGKPGYFKQQLNVYGRGNLDCYVCKALLIETRLGQRTTVYCPKCQK